MFDAIEKANEENIQLSYYILFKDRKIISVNKIIYVLYLSRLDFFLFAFQVCKIPI